MAGAWDSEELNLLDESIAQVLGLECDSIALHRRVDGIAGDSDDLFHTAVELGWLGIALPEAMGGLGLGYRGLAVLHLRLGEALAPGAFMENLSVMQWLSAMDSQPLIGRLVDGLRSGRETIACPADFDIEPLRLDAVGAVSGCCPFMMGRVDSAWAIIPAVAPDNRRLWAVLDIAKTGGLTRLQGWDRLKSLSSLEVAGTAPLMLLDERRYADGQRLEHILSLAVACESLGSAQRIFSVTLEYLITREQFGRRIGSFQALQHRMADIAAELALTEEMVWHAACCLTNGGDDSGFWASLAKLQATDIHMHAATEAIQLHGAIGFTWEHDAHLHLKRAALNQRLVRSPAGHLDHAHALIERVGPVGRILSDLPI